uniref:Putative lipocalin n=1 Tax=Rhipicephalus microplus TaxID=6941 RepID=A0A6G5A5V3_RHIMP
MTMKFRPRVFLFIFLHYLTVTECKLPSVKTIYDIRKFLWTKGPIWTFMTTGSTHCLCQEDVTQYIDETSILYNHYYLSPGHTRKHIRMSGSFPQKNCMIVHPYGSSSQVTHKIIYFNPHFKCAVVKVSSMISPGGTTNMLDLRVWNSSDIATSAQQCLAVFRKKR